ncbi:MAG: low-specificity L-threonine aldolase [Actinobacteria bacterium]|nr:low-specificity L-threonine aldolase [Actinomycetota bacterium]
MRFIDLRSDTVTEPTPAMLKSMVDAVVGDDVYGDDPTVNKLQKVASKLLGKEDALFVPSGTFGNQLAILTHTSRGDEVVIPEDNHIVIHEVGAPQVISGVGLRLLNSDNGKIDLRELEKKFRSDDIHFPRTGLICTENAHSNGKVVPASNIKDVYSFSRKMGVPLHLDGARIFNASIKLEVEPFLITKYCDSVMVCLSKGLCSPVGSILAGSKEFINRARKNRKMMGGGMRQAGYLAAPGIISLEKMVKRLKEDHDSARYLADCIEETGYFKVDRNHLDINMVFCKAVAGDFDQNQMIEYLFKNMIKINPSSDGEFRFVTHYWIDRENIRYVARTFKNFFNGT